MKTHEELTGSPNKEYCVWCAYAASPTSSESCRAMVRSSSSREVVVLEVEVVEPKYPWRDHTPPKRIKEIRLSIYLTQIPTLHRSHIPPGISQDIRTVATASDWLI